LLVEKKILAVRIKTLHWCWVGILECTRF